MINSNGSPKGFKDCLRGLIDNNGGMTTENAQRIVEKAREVAPDFSVQRLVHLWNGISVSDHDRPAISHALEPLEDQWLSEKWPLEDEESRRIAKLVVSLVEPHLVSMNSRRRFATKFVSNGIHQVRFRSERVSKDDLSEVVEEHLLIARWEDEIDLFGL